MKLNYLIAGFALLTMVVFTPMVKAFEPTTVDEDIGPMEYAAVPLIPIGDTESMDVNIESDIPITVYIIDSQEDYDSFIAVAEGDFDNFTGYEQKYEDITSKKITQDYDAESSYWVMLYNPSESDTASVSIEYEFEDLASEIIEDAVSDACCALAMGTGVIGTICLLAAAIAVRKR